MTAKWFESATSPYFSILQSHCSQLWSNNLQYLGREKQAHKVCSQQTKQPCSYLPYTDIMSVIANKDTRRSKIIPVYIYTCVCIYVCNPPIPVQPQMTGFGGFGVLFSNYHQCSDVISIWPCQTGISKHKQNAFDFFWCVYSICSVNTSSGVGKGRREGRQYW